MDAGAKHHIIVSSSIHHLRRQSLIEIALIFAVFFIQGAWPVPEVNESYYLGKAIHYWNPGWLEGDFFLESADAHEVFYFTFGWLSLWLPPVALAWTGRTICWLLLAWGWRRLSFAVVPRPWWSVLTAALFVCLMEWWHMAGEWVVGGVEAKPFAYALVFFGLEAVLRNRWNRGLLLMGAAAAFHPLVGGWSAVAAGIAWLRLRTIDTRPRPAVAPRMADAGRGFMETPSLRALWPGILGGLLLSLPGLIPALALDWGVDQQTAREAHQLYVFERLPHHLFLPGIYPALILRMALLCCFWLLLGIWRNRLSMSEDFRRTFDVLRAFVAGAVAIALAGAAIHLLIPLDPGLAAGLLRYYWFRLIDVALPLGVALEGAALIVGALAEKKGTDPICAKHPPGRSGKWGPSPFFRPTAGRCWLAFAIVVAAFHLGDRAVDRIAPAPPRSHKMAEFKEWKNRRADFDDWCAACDWIARSGEIPPDALFLTPRLSQTFRWYAGRSEVVAWKDVPQAAPDIVQWWGRLQDVYGTGFPLRSQRWYGPLAAAGAEHLERLGAKYRAGYAITDRTEPPLDLDVVYCNRTYVIYRLGGK